VKRAFEMARAYGVAVEFADLGAWGAVELRSEYDPHGPVIRINTRVTMREGLPALCIYHELYHHREAIGDVQRQGSRRAREAAADAFARAQALLD
jgi:predicted transcriptional regulator